MENVNENKWKDMLKNDSRIGHMFILGVASFLIALLIVGILKITYGEFSLTASDFNVISGLKISEDGHTINTLDRDGWMVVDFEEDKNIKIVSIHLEESIGKDWILQLFFASHGEGFSENESVIYTVESDEKDIVIQLSEKDISRLRIDWGDDIGNVFELREIVINNSINKGVLIIILGFVFVLVFLALKFLEDIYLRKIQCCLIPMYVFTFGIVVLVFCCGYRVLQDIHILSNRQASSNMRIFCISSMALLINLGLLSFLLYIWKKNITIKLFFFVSVFSGILLRIIAPPFSNDDECRHFIRIYDLIHNEVEIYKTDDWSNAKGNIIVQNDGTAILMDVPYELNNLRLVDIGEDVDDITYRSEINTTTDLTKLVELLRYPKNSIYDYQLSAIGVYGAGMIQYIPQVIFASIANLLGLNAVWQYYFACLGNIVLISGVMSLCMKIMPMFRSVFWVFMFSPHFSLFWVSCNRDIMLISMVLLLICYIMYLRDNCKKLNIARIFLISLMLGWIAICKLPYVTVGLLVLLLMKDNFRLKDTKKINYILCKLGYSFIVLLFSLCIYLGYSSLHNTIIQNRSLQSVDEDIQITELTEDDTISPHMQYFMKNPEKVLFSICERFCDIITKDLPGAIKGYGIHRFGQLYLGVAMVILVFQKRILLWYEQSFLLTVFCICWFGICAAGYLMASPDLGYIWGISYRYMFPILPLFGMGIALGNSKMFIQTEKIPAIFSVGLMLLDAEMLLTSYL